MDLGTLRGLGISLFTGLSVLSRLICLCRQREVRPAGTPTDDDDLMSSHLRCGLLFDPQNSRLHALPLAPFGGV